jgi:hypothetical protein
MELLWVVDGSGCDGGGKVKCLCMCMCMCREGEMFLLAI